MKWVACMRRFDEQLERGFLREALAHLNAYYARGYRKEPTYLA